MAARKTFRIYQSATRVRPPNALVSENLSTSVESSLPAAAGTSNLGAEFPSGVPVRTLVHGLSPASVSAGSVPNLVSFLSGCQFQFSCLNSDSSNLKFQF